MPADKMPTPEESWFYLSVTYDEAMYNHDPASLGTVVGDPNYYPVDSGTIYFFGLGNEPLAQRLVRLFDRSVKPKVERKDETRLRVSFSCDPRSSFDDDAVFLIEEEIDAARAEVEHLDRKWQMENKSASPSGCGSVSAQKHRPLAGDLLSHSRLFDQARRWAERLGSDRNRSDVVTQAELPAPSNSGSPSTNASAETATPNGEAAAPSVEAGGRHGESRTNWWFFCRPSQAELMVCGVGGTTPRWCAFGQAASLSDFEVSAILNALPELFTSTEDTGIGSDTISHPGRDSPLCHVPQTGCSKGPVG